MPQSEHVFCLAFDKSNKAIGYRAIGGWRLSWGSDHEMVEFSVRGEAQRGASKTTTMGFRRADFGLFRMLVEKVLWERVLKGKRVQAGWTFFREEVLKAQEQAVPMCCKTNQWGRRRACLNRELLLGLLKKRRVYHLWKKGLMTQKEYRGLVRSCREEIRKAKAQLELRLVAGVRDNKRCLYKYINNKKRASESLRPLLDARGNIANKDEEYPEVLNACFASAFNRPVIPRIVSPSAGR